MATAYPVDGTASSKSCLSPLFQRDPIGIWTDTVNLGNGYSLHGSDLVNGRDPFGWEGEDGESAWSKFWWGVEKIATAPGTPGGMFFKPTETADAVGAAAGAAVKRIVNPGEQLFEDAKAAKAAVEETYDDLASGHPGRIVVGVRNVAITYWGARELAVCGAGKFREWRAAKANPQGATPATPANPPEAPPAEPQTTPQPQVNPAAPEAPPARARHHTSPEAAKQIKSEGKINPSRGEPRGVDVEVEPFRDPKTARADTGAAGEGAYVEIDLPEGAVPTDVGPRRTARIPSEEPLPIKDLNPKVVVHKKWWHFWKW